MFVAVIKRATGIVVREIDGNKQEVIDGLHDFYIPKSTESLDDVVQSIALYESTGGESLPISAWYDELQNKQIAEREKLKETEEKALLAELKAKYGDE